MDIGFFTVLRLSIKPSDKTVKTESTAKTELMEPTERMGLMVQLLSSRSRITIYMSLTTVAHGKISETCKVLRERPVKTVKTVTTA